MPKPFEIAGMSEKDKQDQVARADWTVAEAVGEFGRINENHRWFDLILPNKDEIWEALRTSAAVAAMKPILHRQEQGFQFIGARFLFEKA